MKQRDLDTVAIVAHKVRDWAESYAIKHSEHFGKDLGGLCAITSRKIHQELKQKGIQSSLHLFEGDNYGHCFITVGNYVVDVTATQFRVRGKVIILPREIATRVFWISHKQFNEAGQLMKYQKETGWPYEQTMLLK